MSNWSTIPVVERLANIIENQEPLNCEGSELKQLDKLTLNITTKVNARRKMWLFIIFLIGPRFDVTEILLSHCRLSSALVPRPAAIKLSSTICRVRTLLSSTKGSVVWPPGFAWLSHEHRITRHYGLSSDGISSTIESYTNNTNFRRRDDSLHCSNTVSQQNGSR